ncbi:MULTISPECIES: hypothetical protein [Gordonia]|uniref:hypothetical protein n=1 Tax=Gordonia TaxID=2053 RepID=UPI00196471F3|nr:MULTISPECIES: hypothetical protein [unclassified Gordonia (in: high G+C Gram-positive bacteria)]MBN0975099.1 hypothetical protein [Gordonia sp. BP-119]MBN0985272.1 hypothetical protein [Gordonia sp. BP-94]
MAIPSLWVLPLSRICCSFPSRHADLGVTIGVGYYMWGLNITTNPYGTTIALYWRRIGPGA